MRSWTEADQIFTPWRLPFIVGPRPSGGCIFCELPRDSSENLILHRGATAFVIMNLYPYTLGHTMAIPYRHLPRSSALDERESAELSALLQATERILRRELRAEVVHMGINLGAAGGAGVRGHLHAHLVPRYAPGDPRAEPELDETVETTFDRLRPHFADLG